ncbi:MAG: extracellular solute-binding protein [Lachnospiraceae bacterium]|nr:extracellular solute-binding protein [Lachnospiraceae bacterium]
MKRFISLVLAACTFSVMLCGCMDKDNKKTNDDVSREEQLELASTTPFEKYPERITYTLGKEISTNNSNMPAGDTYEDNAYTRYLLEKLNIQNVNEFESMGDKYNTEVSMSIAMSDIPDIMVVNNFSDVALMYKMGLLADLTESYENCASDNIKQMYESYGDELLDSVTFEGKIIAIPETNIAEGPSLLWLRKDWMDDLGLEEPSTLEDVEYIISKFIEDDSNRVGLVTNSSLCGESGYSSQYMTDIVFANFGAYPKQWIQKEDGSIVYGSIQPEAKEALRYLNSWYDKGILDRDFLFRSSSDIIGLIESGRCGSFFGPWWSTNNPLLNMVEEDKSIEWKPYLISTNDDGITVYPSTSPTNYKYVVVSKDFEHPEIAWKIISAIFDYARYEDKENATELGEYDKNAVDPTARPLVINVDYKDALKISYENISGALNGEKDIEDINQLERSYAEQCQEYLDSGGNYTAQQWAAYESRITACSLIASDSVVEIDSLYFTSTTTMETSWWRLKELESNVYLRIITGQVSVDFFDKFVQEWENLGGTTISKEVEETINRDK